MVGAIRWVPVVFFGLALAALAVALSSGGAHLYLAVIVPILTGSSPWFLVGVALLVVGFLSVPFAWAGDTLEGDPPKRSTEPGPRPGQSGGVILVGPFPIFFGSFRDLPAHTKWIWAIVGIALTAFLVATIVLVWA